MKKTYGQLVKSVRFYRALLVVVALTVGIVEITTINTQEDRILELENNVSKCGGYEDSEQRFKNTLEVLYLQNNRVNELETANEALMRQLDKCNGLTKAIKCTPMPKMKRA